MSRFTGALPAFVALTLLAAAPTFAAAPPCAPCAGVEVRDAGAFAAALSALPGEAPKLGDEARLYVAAEAALDGSASPDAALALAAAGATPFTRLVFRTPAPLTTHLDALKVELDAAAALARSRPKRAHYQIAWRSEGPGEHLAPAEYAFLVKRASVAVTGEDPDAVVVSAPLPADPAWLDRLYAEEVAAYLDALALPSGASGAADALAAAVAKLGELDPGKPLILDSADWPAEPLALLPAAADAAERGFALALFDAREAERAAAEAAAAAAGVAPEAAPGTVAGEVPPAAPIAPSGVTLAHLQTLVLLANEFQGDLSLDAATRPEGARRAWSFVRGEDLALRVIAEAEPGAARLGLRFPDPTLKSPTLVQANGKIISFRGNRGASSFDLGINQPGAAVVLRLERASIAELEGVEEKVTVETERQMPVEEILRRLQAFEEAQNRRIAHWQAVNTTTLRFQAASGTQAVEATFEGAVFFRPGQPFDWAWQTFYLNGVRWKGKEIPEIPLVQPERAAAMPLEILFTKEYRYSLRGTERVGERDCWAVEFEPAAPVEGRTLFRGTVWVDRETWARVRTRAVQLGLEGDVLSNEETIDYTPVDATGAASAWGTSDAFVLPLHTVAQQVLSVLNAGLVVEKEVVLGAVEVNGADFETKRAELFASKTTIVRDTDAGLRYMVPEEGGEPGARVVKEGFDASKLFLLGGAFYDDSLEYPLPLVGLNYFDLDFRGGKRQLNAFFGGVLGIVNYSDPNLFGSRADLGVDLFAIAFANSDQLYRDGVESPGEEVEELPARATLNFGFPLGSFVKVSSGYRLAYSKYSRTDDTAPEFVLPSDHFRHRVDLGLQFARGGYRFNVTGAANQRSTWDFWGLPGNTEFDPDSERYYTWEASASKNWYFPGFKKLGVELNYLGGENLDRFSKYQFGFFGGNRVHGYQIGKVRAEEAFALHLSSGLEIGNVVRLDAVGDVAWATDETSGYDNEMLAGVGIAGSFVGPWQTLVQVDIGTPVAGPDDGVVAYVVFLKLFN